jgi:hypothetical protein
MYLPFVYLFSENQAPAPEIRKRTGISHIHIIPITISAAGLVSGFLRCHPAVSKNRMQ